MYNYYCICCDLEFESTEALKSYEALCNTCTLTHFICDRCKQLKIIMCRPIHICCKKYDHIRQDCCLIL